MLVKQLVWIEVEQVADPVNALSSDDVGTIEPQFEMGAIGFSRDPIVPIRVQHEVSARPSSPWLELDPIGDTVLIPHPCLASPSQQSPAQYPSLVLPVDVEGEIEPRQKPTVFGCDVVELPQGCFARLVQDQPITTQSLVMISTFSQSANPTDDQVLLSRQHAREEYLDRVDVGIDPQSKGLHGPARFDNTESY